VFAVPALEALAQSRHEIVVVLTRPDRPRGRGQRMQRSPVADASERLGLRCLTPERVNAAEVAADLAGLGIDVLAVVAFGAILRGALLGVPRLAAVNVHPSLLPALRGPAPIERAVWEGHSWTGVTIQHVSAEIDAGDVVLQRAVAIGPEETAGELTGRLATVGARLLVRALDDIESGSAQRIPQNAAHATSAPILRREDGLIEWERDAFEIAARIRAVTPAPGARATIGGREVLVHRARPVDHITRAPVGQIVDISAEDGIVVSVGRGHVAVLDVQAAGRRALAAHEFARGARVTVGDMCGRAIVPPAESEVHA